MVVSTWYELPGDVPYIRLDDVPYMRFCWHGVAFEFALNQLHSRGDLDGHDGDGAAW